MSYQLTRFELLVRCVSSTWKIRINKFMNKDQIEEAIFLLTKDYSFLSSEYKENTDILEYKENYHPPVHFFEKSYSDLEYWENIKQTTSKKCNNTSEYFIYANKSENETIIIGIYNHGMVDGLSSLNLCHKLCLYLSNPTIEPKLHGYVSAQDQIVIPKDAKYMNYNVDIKLPILKLPSYLHECKDPNKLYYRVYTGLIKENDLKDILKYTKQIHCSFQGLLWIVTLLSQMKLFNIIDFSKYIRFHSMSTCKGRAEFNPPVLEDDITRSGFYSYVTKKINENDKIVDVIVDLSKELHKELDKKEQLYDFFMFNDFSKCPSYSLSCCTMGKRPNQKHYEGKFSFDVLDQNFLAADNIDGNNTGMRLFSFTVDGVGCYISNNYIYPQFTDEEMKSYVEDIIKMMKYCSKEENINITVGELIKIK